MQRTLVLLFGLFAYAIFLPTFLYLIAFVGNLQVSGLVEWMPALEWLVPYSISFGRESTYFLPALLINVALITLFGLQHSIMARSGFKDWLKQSLPASAERSVYVLLSSLVLIVLFWQWRPLSNLIWSVESQPGLGILWAVFAIGFGMVFIATFLIDHFELFGLRQIWSNFRNRPFTQSGFVTPAFYRIVRHPLYLGFLLAFWSTPFMTVGHLVFATGMTGYILIGIRFEERDLNRFLGDDYRRYQEQVPRLVPMPGRVYRKSESSDAGLSTGSH